MGSDQLSVTVTADNTDLLAKLAAAGAAVRAFSDELRNSAGRTASAGQALYGQDLAKYSAALDEKTALAKRAADEQANIAAKRYNAQWSEQQRQLTADLHGDDTKGSGGLFGSPETAAANAEAVVAKYRSAIDQLAEHNMEIAQQLYPVDPAKAQVIAEEVTEKFVAAQQQAADRMAEIQAQTAAKISSQWGSINKDIASGLSDGIMAALQGKKGGIAQAMKGWLSGQIKSGLNDLFSSGLSGLEGTLGLSGSSPGSLIGKLFGTGSASTASSAGSAAQTAATTANTTAATAQTAAITAHTAATGTSAAATAVNTGATTVNTGAQTTGAAASTVNSAATTANTGGLLTSAATWIENTVATLANTIATDAAAIVQGIGDILPFADGGSPPVGVPSLVGERGPELFVPHSAGTIVPNGRFALGRSFSAGGGGGMSVAQMVQHVVSSTSTGGDIHLNQTINHTAGRGQSDAESLASAALRGGRRGALQMRRALKGR